MKKPGKLLLITIASAFGGLLFGYDTGVINGSQYYLSQYFDLNAVMKGWVVGSALLGCFLGAVVSGILSSKFGRKNSLIISSILFLLSAWGSGLPQFLPQTVSILVISRVIGGIAIGIASMNVPIYIAEIAPAKKRGNLVSYYQLAIVIGFFLVFVVTYLVAETLTQTDNIQNGWRYMFWSEIIPSLIFLVLLFFIPKSPRWLLLIGQRKKSLEILTQIHGNELAREEFDQINNSIKKQKESSTASIFTSKNIKIITIGVILATLQQFTGINAVLYYGADIFENSLGIAGDDLLSQQILLAVFNLLFTFIAMVTIDKIGRKFLIYIGSVGMILGFSMLGLSLYFMNVGIISLIGVLLFVSSFAVSMGPVVWVLLSEMFPNNIRSIAMSISVAATWIANYLVSQSFPVIVDSSINNNSWNGSLPYFLFIFFILITIVFTHYFIPETKQKSLEALEDSWNK